MASLKDDFIYDEKTIDAEIEDLENEQYDLGETFCVCDSFETDEMILCARRSSPVRQVRRAPDHFFLADHGIRRTTFFDRRSSA